MRSFVRRPASLFLCAVEFRSMEAAGTDSKTLVACASASRQDFLHVDLDRHAGAREPEPLIPREILSVTSISPYYTPADRFRTFGADSGPTDQPTTLMATWCTIQNADVRPRRTSRHKESSNGSETFSATPTGRSISSRVIDGSETFEEVGAFAGKSDWRTLNSKMLDARYCALDFFSEGGFRFFLPATPWPIVARNSYGGVSVSFVARICRSRPMWRWDRTHFAAVRAEMARESQTLWRNHVERLCAASSLLGTRRGSGHRRVYDLQTRTRHHGIEQSRIDAALKQLWSIVRKPHRHEGSGSPSARGG